MTKLSSLFAMAAAGTLATAAFVRPPVSPAPKGVATNAPVAFASPKPSIPLGGPAAKPAAFAVAKAPAPRSLSVETITFAPWGNAVGELGRSLPNEANPEAPMSLAVDAAGVVHVLDQVNERIAIFDPAGTRVVPIASDTVQDLAVDPRGGWALLDRHVDAAVIFLDPAGKERTRIGLVGQGVPDPGLVTALFAAHDGFWVEVEHGTLTRIATKDADPDPSRLTLEGRRPWPKGPLLRAARDPSGYAVVSANAGASSGFFARVPMRAPVLELLGLEGDASGTTFVAAHVGREEPTEPFAIVDEKVVVVALDGKGDEIGRAELPPPEGPEEQHRSIAVGPNGLVHLHVGATGATLRRIR